MFFFAPAQDTLRYITTPSQATNFFIIGSIHVNGNTRTNDAIILREIPFAVGDSLATEDLYRKLIIAKQQIINTSLFISVEVSIAGRNGHLASINIDVKERWYLLPVPYFKLVDRNFNQWWVEQHHSLSRVNYGLKLIQNNVTGRNDNAYLWLITGYNHQVSLRYEQPFADKRLKHGFSGAFSFSQQREVNYATAQNNKQLFYAGNKYVKQQMRIEASYLYRPATRTRHSFTLKLIDEKIDDTVAALKHFYFPGPKTHITYPVFNYTLKYFNADNYSYPTKGFIGDFMLTRKGFGRDMNLWRIKFHSKYTLPLYHNMQLQLQASGILNAPFDQPFVNNQIVNYYNDFFIRGLEYYVIDGSAAANIRAAWRQQLFSYILKSPVHVKNHEEVPVRFYLKSYGDAGYVYNSQPQISMLNNKPLFTWGFGLDIVTIYDIVIKLEYSFNHFGDHGLYVHSSADY